MGEIDIFMVLILLVAAVIVVGILLTLYWAEQRYRFLKDKGKLKLARALKLVAIAVCCFIAYWIIGAIWPYDWFYKRSFYDYTQIRFPENGHIVYKVSNWEFEACAIEVDTATYSDLLARLPNNCAYSDRQFEAVGVTDHYDLTQVAQAHYCTMQSYVPACVVFINDHKTIIFMDGEIHNAFESTP